MARRALVWLGAVMAMLGFLAALASLALPWATYSVRADVRGLGPDFTDSGKVAVFQLDHGWWYVTALLVLAGVLAAAAGSAGWAARIAGSSAVPLGVVTVLAVFGLSERISNSRISGLTSALATVDVSARPGAGIDFGLAAAVLLALGAALVSLRTPVG